ncbi:mannitol dehydrogenase family protein [Streptomyces sp. AC495_CC817]|uniref:mannitol dehydrogenase family protein n=1 Tax=Streptomyces sp. AC495_CC817 TaxID=2823900 RepID=UPI001C27BE32|nr:mannitol dehydrogenase family protein [Streptomyces sp. AC495_CC817]
MTGPRRTAELPVRAAHLGLGAFHRAHQAWYTHTANNAQAPDEGWGIAAFTGRSPEAALRLAAQDGVYTLLTRSAQGDEVEVVQSIVRAASGADDAAWLGVLADPAVALLTVTVTEPGYGHAAGPPARIAQGLAARRAAGAGPLAVVSCDNLLGNGRLLRDAVLANAGGDAGWIAENVSFVDTVVDRITPAAAPEDRETVRRLTGVDDAAAVVTEPFSEWVLAGAFPAGRPSWELVGARFVADVRPYEERKLWMLNAAHSVLASAGRLRGFSTIAEAFGDPALRALAEALWHEHGEVVDLPASELAPWLADLRRRFDNPRIAHRLDQIRRDSPSKIPQRIIAPAGRRQAAGLDVGEAQREALELWIQDLVTLEPTDEASAVLSRDLGALPPTERVEAVLIGLATERA